jgi:hypothetical protein
MAAGVTATGSTTAPAPAQSAAAAPQANQAVIPFIRGSGRSEFSIKKWTGQTLTSTTQALSQDVKAYGYMRSIRLDVTTTTVGGATGTAQPDAPFNLFNDIKVSQPNQQPLYSVSSGFHAAMIQKYGMARANTDPRADPNFELSGSWATFSLRIPFEIDQRDGLGSLPNKNSAAPYTLDLTLNTLANVFGSSQGTSPTFTIEAFLESYDQPPQTLNGLPVATEPPNKNTLQRWTEQPITMSTGQFDAKVRKLGNYIRMLVPIMKNSSGTRIGMDFAGTAAQPIATNWADPVQIILDETPKDNITAANWARRIYQTWGYGGIFGGTATTAAGGTAGTQAALGATPTIGQDSAGGLDTGVFPIQYFLDGRVENEDVNLYLPTIESEEYLLRGSWGSNCSKLVVLICDVIPQGDIFVV